jgi:hypothetical protein
MNISPRSFGGLLRSGAVAVACLCLGVHALGDEGAPDNPLRQASAVSPVLSPRPIQRATGAAQAAATSSSRPRAESTVRRSDYGVAPTQRLPSRNSLPRNVTVGTSAALQPKPMPNAPKPAPSVMKSAPVEGEIIYEGPQQGTGDILYDGVFGGPDGEFPMQVEGMPDCCGGVGCAQCCLIPCPIIPFQGTELFAGVHGFTGPMNRGATGSFGFDEGVNWGIPMPCTCGALAGQIGMRATQSNFSGAEFTDATRQQVFVTGGLFRRVDWGLQGGVVVDYLSDDWYAKVNLVQVRGELSWVFPCTHELGFWFAASDRTFGATSVFGGDLANEDEIWEPTNLYAFFYRRRFDVLDGAEARFFAGFSGESDGLIGADFRLPLGDRWALNTGFTYLVPEQPAGPNGNGFAEEAWNVGISLVWYPGCRTNCEPNYFRPLFDVAGNGTFLVDRRHAE